MNLDEALEKLVAITGSDDCEANEVRRNAWWANKEYFVIAYYDRDKEFQCFTGHTFEQCFERLHESILFRKFEI